MNIFNFLNHKYFGNSVESYLWFFMILIFGLISKHLVSAQVSRLLYFVFKKHVKSVGSQKIQQLMTRPIELLFTIIIVYLAFNRLVFPAEWQLAAGSQFGIRSLIAALLTAALIVSITWIILRTVDCFGLILLARARRTDSMDDDQLVTFFKESVKVIIAAVGFFVMLGAVFHLDIVSLVTGLGIGGLAIALAAKETLENLFGSFTIFLDKPFVTGDYVRIGAFEGKVENVGFRSTRIRALDKMIVTVPNKKMVDAELINESDRMMRRSSFNLVLSYETSEDQVRNILNEIRALLKSQEMIEKETSSVRFKNFSTVGLEISIIFIVLSPEMEVFLQILEEVNFEIMDIVRKNNTNFAVPFIYKQDLKDVKNNPPGYYKTLAAGK